MIKRINFLVLLLLVTAVTSVNSQISLVNFSSGYNLPVDIKNCGDDRLFIVEQRGVISIADTAGVKKAQPFLDIHTRVVLSSEQGLLGLAFPVDYPTSGYFYVDYVAAPNVTRISRFHVDSLTPDSADPNSEEILLSIYQPYGNHKGGHVGFGPDGYLYIGMGDGGSAGDPQNRAQNTDSLLGKILRIAVDPGIPGYTIPPTNPFANDSTLGRGEIWDYGVRNPWRWSFDAMTGDLWIGDVGQNLVEEVDMEPAGSPGGLNYGWKCWEGTNQFSTGAGCLPYSSYAPPVHTYNHGGFCSITGGYVYRGARYQAMYGKYFYTDYCLSNIQYLEKDSSGGYANTNLGSLGAASISTFGVDRHGELYCAGVNSGIIYKFISADCSPVATINTGRDTLDDCSLGSVDLHVPFDSSYNYIWTLNGDTVSTGATLTATQAGNYIVTVTNQNCINSDSVYVELTSPLVLSFSGLDTLYCVYNSPVNLLPNHIPGTFTGPGMSGASFNPAIAGVGTAMITYTYVSNGGCTYATSQNTRVDACLNVPGNLWTNTIGVYPNPSQKDFYVNAYANTEKRIKMEITDVTGRVVMMEEMALYVGENKIPVHTTLTKGIYMATFTDEISSTSVKMVVQ